MNFMILNTIISNTMVFSIDNFVLKLKRKCNPKEDFDTRPVTNTYFTIQILDRKTIQII